jgi:hypothetical protein
LSHCQPLANSIHGDLALRVQILAAMVEGAARAHIIMPSRLPPPFAAQFCNRCRLLAHRPLRRDELRA